MLQILAGDRPNTLAQFFNVYLSTNPTLSAGSVIVQSACIEGGVTVLMFGAGEVVVTRKLTALEI